MKNFLLLDLGLSLAFPTIVIPALSGLNKELNPNESILITTAQASWLGKLNKQLCNRHGTTKYIYHRVYINSLQIASVAYIFEPLGSLLSGWITEPIGRKKAMFFVNIPHLFAWTMLYYSTTLAEVFVAHILLGLGVGLMEAPIVTYVGEIRYSMPMTRLKKLEKVSTFVDVTLFLLVTKNNIAEILLYFDICENWNLLHVRNLVLHYYMYFKQILGRKFGKASNMELNSIYLLP